MTDLERIKQLLRQQTPEQRRNIFDHLRKEFPIHAIESKLNAQAEIILEAIDRASDLTLRGIRGVIAEAAFATEVITELVGFNHCPIVGDAPYDFCLEDSHGRVRIQVKLQRQKAQRPMLSDEAPRRLGLQPNMFVAETQRTRGGKHHTTGENTRPYRFGEFDILAVSMHPSTRDWSRFMYTVADWLIPRPEQPHCIETYQPVAKSPNDLWTDDLLQCIHWLRSGVRLRLDEQDEP